MLGLLGPAEDARLSPATLGWCAYSISKVMLRETPMNVSVTFQTLEYQFRSSDFHYLETMKELHLLFGELKDCDKELNDMVTVHQRQLLSWEKRIGRKY